MRDSESVTRRPSGLESAMAFVASAPIARVCNCRTPAAKRSSAASPQNASAMTVTEMAAVEAAVGAIQTANTAAARASARPPSATGFAVHSIRCAADAGAVDFIKRVSPEDDSLRRIERHWVVLPRKALNVSLEAARRGSNEARVTVFKGLVFW